VSEFEGPPLIYCEIFLFILSVLFCNVSYFVTWLGKAWLTGKKKGRTAR
jgi:hypothetical protein